MAWDDHALRKEIDGAVDGYADQLARERVTVKVGLVTAVLRLDGVLDDLVVDPRALRRHSAEELAELITETIRAAEHEAAGLREVVADTVTYLGYPVHALVQQMIDDPHAVVRRLAGDAEVRR